MQKLINKSFIISLMPPVKKWTKEGQSVNPVTPSHHYQHLGVMKHTAILAHILSAVTVFKIYT